MRLTARLLLLSCSLFSLTGVAATVTDLYQVLEPVSSQQPAERDEAIGRAFDTLVLRLTGQADAAQKPALAELKKDPQQIISRYGYEGSNLQVDFDPVSTDRELRQAGLSLWGSNRPLILIWWLNQDEYGNTLVGDGIESAETIRQSAQHRGLPVRMPLADLSEQLVATPENLAASQPDALEPISERYGADSLLAVTATQSAEKWSAEWSLWVGTEREQGNASGQDLASLSDAVLLEVSQRLAKRYAVAASASSSLTVEISGANLSRYAELQQALEPFDATLSKVEGDRLIYRVKANADQLRAQLGLLNLREVSADEVAPEAQEPSQDPAEQGQPEAPAPQIVPRSDVLRFSW